jgi:CHASE2 domain-containing sensor protein
MKKYSSFLNRLPKLINTQILTYIFYLSLPFVIIAPLRFSQIIQPLEWIALDTVLRLRPTEKADPKITIISIDKEDIQYLNGKAIVDSISDIALAETIEKIAAAQPAAIGVDIIRDQPTGAEGKAGFTKLQQVMNRHSNVIGIYQVQEPGYVAPIPNVSAEQLGFSDSIVDQDGRERRALLVKNHGYSLAFQLSRLYLEQQQIGIEVANDREIITSNNKKIKSLIAPWGIYKESDLTDYGGLQLIINYRNDRQSFENIPLRKILKEGIPKSLKDRIVIIGYTDPNKQDYSYTNAIAHDVSDSMHMPGIISGVEYHAHISSQLINHVISDRPILTPLNSIWDFLWVLSCTALIIFSPKYTAARFSLIRYFMVLATIYITMYVLLLTGIWVPVASTIITFTTASTILASILTKSSEEAKKNLEIALEQEKATEEAMEGVLYGIEITNSSIHETALQTLASIISSSKPPSDLMEAVKKVDREIRAVSDQLEDEQIEDYAVKRETRKELSIQEELRGTYERFVKCSLRNQEEFKSKINFAISIVDFEGFKDETMNKKDKTRLRIFLMEALNNVRKHAPTATRLRVIGGIDKNNYYLSISDNGKEALNTDISRERAGTKQAKKLETQLQGKFERRPIQPSGCECIITWPVHRK